MVVPPRRPRRSPAQPGAEGTRPRGGGGACLAIAARGAGGRGAEGRHGGGERFLLCPRPVREVGGAVRRRGGGVGSGPACVSSPSSLAALSPRGWWWCGGEVEKGARAFLPAARGMRAGKSPGCEGMFVRHRKEVEEGGCPPSPPGSGTSGAE